MNQNEIEKLPMNILLCGTKIEKIYVKSLFTEKVLKTKKNHDDYEEYTNSYDWKFDFFKEGLENYNLQLIMNKIKSDYDSRNFKDIIVCFIDSVNNNNEKNQNSLNIAKKVIEFFSKQTIIYHTFITFITTNNETETKKSLYTFIEDELEDDFDSRNIDVIHYDSNNITPLFNLLFYKSCYFNEMGNELILPTIDSNNVSQSKRLTHCFNIFIIGKPGTGKSTFINILNGGKYAKEGTGGGKVTEKITKYRVKNSNIMIYDTPGFGAGNELNEVSRYIKKEINEMKDLKEKFFCIIYMLDHSLERDFEKNEEELIEYLLTLKIPFYFILNKSQKPKESIKKKKNIRDNKKEIVEERLKNTFPGNEKYLKVISVNIKVNENDYCFGLDQLFQNLFDFYKNYKIDLEQLKINKNNSTKIKNIIKDSPFFEGLLSKKDILENITSRCNKVIIAFSFFAAGVGFIPISFSDWPLLVGTQISMVIVIAAQFGKEIDSIKAKDIVSSLKKTTVVGTVIGGAGKIIGSFIKFFPIIGDVVGGAICGSTAGFATYSLGEAAISFFTPDFSEFDFFYQRSESFNKSIDHFKKLSEDFAKNNDYLLLFAN